jgi:phosphoribosylglycinamide formyltransferase-1
VRIGVLASGTGSILSAILEAELPVEVVVVDRSCAAEKVAESFGVALEAVVRKDFSKSFDRDAYTDEVVATLRRHQVELVVMAGYGTVLGRSVHAAYPDRVLNTHPALLPAFKGWHAVDEALAAGVKLTGCTVHLTTLEVDEGLILAQEAVPVLDGDTEETLHERIKTVERRLYPETVRRVLETLEKGEELS